MIPLHGKVKEDFEKWLESKDVAPYKVMFYDIPKIVQQAYIIEWLDSIESLCFQEILLETYNNNYRMYPLNSIFKEAIKKAVEIYNLTK